MTRDEAKEAVRQSWRQLLPQITGKANRKGYLCPICNSGSGPKGTGMTMIPNSPGSFHCHACGFTGDVFDIYQEKTGKEFPAALDDLANMAGISIDERPARKDDRQGHGEGRQGSFTPKGEEYANQDENEPETAAEEPQADYTNYYRVCRQRLLESQEARAYLQGRGIDPERAAALYIGYDPAADPASAPGATGEEDKRHPCKRIIIPTSKTHYVARSIDPETPKEYSKINPAGGSPGIFNGRALAQDVQEVFITEGAFDALSILEAGRPAVAINSTANVRTLLAMLETTKPAAKLILCLDNDPAGQRAQEDIIDGLERLKIAYSTADICNGAKDPNEALTTDRKRFFAAVDAATGRRPDSTAHYINFAMAREITALKGSVKSTGFLSLDDAAGGIYPGLYTIAATPSLGKTTFCLQMADQMAEAGSDVIFFSLEQSRLELVTKSIARRTARENMQTAVTSLSIRRGGITQRVLQAVDDYLEKTGGRVSIVEGNFNCNVSFIGQYVREYIAKNNVLPVVFVDYLQIIQPDDKRKAAKEAVDEIITGLKRISRDLNITIFVVSSLNRQNYNVPVDFNSLKETGGIEYTCDVVYGLQLKEITTDAYKRADITDQRERIKEAKSKVPREIQLVCLKNRYGIANFTCDFLYYPAHDLFTEGELPKQFRERRTK